MDNEHNLVTHNQPIIYILGLSSIKHRLPRGRCMLALHSAGCAVMLHFLPGTVNPKWLLYILDTADSLENGLSCLGRKDTNWSLSSVFLSFQEEDWWPCCFHCKWQHASHCRNCVFHIVPYCCLPTWDCILNAEDKYFAIEWRQVSLLVDVKVLPMKSTGDRQTLSFFIIFYF